MPTNQSSAAKAAKILLWTGAALGAAALSNALLFNKAAPLQSSLEGGETRYFSTPFGDLHYQKAGSGPPLLLVHGVGAGCSSFEFRHVWGELAKNHTVFALDLLGFGKSDKPNIDYSADLLIDLLGDFVRDVMESGENGKQKTGVIASSLGAAFIIALAARRPELFNRLVLVCPTGLQTLAQPPTEVSHKVRPLLRTPIVGATLYNTVSSHVGIRYYLGRRVYARPETATWEVVKHYHQAAHQPGGPNAIASFVTGFLNVPVEEAWKPLSNPVLLVWGDAPHVETPQKQADAFLQTNSRARLAVIPDAGMLPHEEQPQIFLREVVTFLQTSPY